MAPVRFGGEPPPVLPLIAFSADPAEYDSRQLIPGAYVRAAGWHYLFLCAADYSDPRVEAGGSVTTAIWRARSLRGPWERPKAPQLVGTQRGWDEDNVCVMGAAVAPDGRIAATYAGYSYFNQSHQTDRLGIAFGDAANAFDPAAWEKVPDAILTRGPEPWDNGAMHEHDLVRLENGTYVLFYTGGCGGDCGCPGNFCDEGGLATSQDMVTWSKYAGNPTLPYSQVRDRFDSKHRRPRSLNRIGEWWYLQYEGGSHSEIIDHNCSSIDSVGLARSRHIEGPWEHHPLQISIPQQPGRSISSVWTGWPRCTIDDQPPTGEPSLFCFYAAGGMEMLNTSLRHAVVGWKTWSIAQYTAWQ